MTKSARNTYGWNLEGHRVHGFYNGQPFIGKVTRSQLGSNGNAFLQYIDVETPIYALGDPEAKTIGLIENYFYVYENEGKFYTYIEYVEPIDTFQSR